MVEAERFEEALHRQSVAGVATVKRIATMDRAIPRRVDSREPLHRRKGFQIYGTRRAGQQTSRLVSNLDLERRELRGSHARLTPRKEASAPLLNGRAVLRPARLDSRRQWRHRIGLGGGTGRRRLL